MIKYFLGGMLLLSLTACSNSVYWEEDLKSTTRISNEPLVNPPNPSPSQQQQPLKNISKSRKQPAKKNIPLKESWVKYGYKSS